MNAPPILSPPPGERAGVRGKPDENAGASTPHLNPLPSEGRGSQPATDQSPVDSRGNDLPPVPSPPLGERVGVKGPLRPRGQQRTRTNTARDFARHLRKDSTDAEKRFWRLLRDRRFAGFKFRRQYPCGIYFLDFYCTLARLAVELDGGGHGFPDQRTKDETRNQFLAGQGIKVLRFWNHQMRGELEAVRFEIWHALMERTGQTEKIAGFMPKPPAPGEHSR